MFAEQPRPGDLIICRIPGGYLVGRLRPILEGTADPDLDVVMCSGPNAFHFARRCAEREGVVAWREVDGRFEPVDFEMLPVL